MRSNSVTSLDDDFSQEMHHFIRSDPFIPTEWYGKHFYSLYLYKILSKSIICQVLVGNFTCILPKCANTKRFYSLLPHCSVNSHRRRSYPLCIFTFRTQIFPPHFPRHSIFRILRFLESKILPIISLVESFPPGFSLLSVTRGQMCADPHFWSVLHKKRPL